MNRKQFLSAAAVVLTHVLVAPLRADEVVTLTGDPWPPYVIGVLGEDATEGTCVDLIEQVFARLDKVEARFPLIPWERALREVRAGTKDGIAMLLKTPEREQYMAYTDSLFTSYNLIWYSTRRFSSGFSWDRLEDLTPYTVGVVRGYSYGRAVDEAIAEGRLTAIEVNDVGQLFTMLAGDRIELVLANDAVGHAFSKQYDKYPLVAADKPTGEDVYYMAFSKKSPARRLIPRINEIIAALGREGAIDRTVRGD